MVSYNESYGFSLPEKRHACVHWVFLSVSVLWIPRRQSAPPLSEWKSLSVRLCDPMDCSLPGSSVHGILQARILEWVAILFSKRSSWLRDWTWLSCIASRFFTVWATREGAPLPTPWGLWSQGQPREQQQIIVDLGRIIIYSRSLMNQYAQGTLSWIFCSTEFITKSFIITKLSIKNYITSLSSLACVIARDPSVFHPHHFVPTNSHTFCHSTCGILVHLLVCTCISPISTPEAVNSLREGPYPIIFVSFPLPCLQKSPQLCLRWRSIRGVMIELSINQIHGFHVVGEKKVLESERSRFESQLNTGLTVTSGKFSCLIWK